MHMCLHSRPHPVRAIGPWTEAGNHRGRRPKGAPDRREWVGIGCLLRDALRGEDGWARWSVPVETGWPALIPAWISAGDWHLCSANTSRWIQSCCVHPTFASPSEGLRLRELSDPESRGVASSSSSGGPTPRGFAYSRSAPEDPVSVDWPTRPPRAGGRRSSQ